MPVDAVIFGGSSTVSAGSAMTMRASLAKPGSVTRSGRLMPTSLHAAASSWIRPAPNRTEVGNDQLPRMVSGDSDVVFIDPDREALWKREVSPQRHRGHREDDEIY